MGEKWITKKPISIMAYTLPYGKRLVYDNLSPYFIIGGIISGISPSMATFIVSSAAEGKEGMEKLKIGFKTKSSF